MPQGLTWRAGAMVLYVIVAQVIGASLLVKSAGFKAPGATLACVLVLVSSFWMMARIIQEGLPLGLLMPMLAALVPLATIGVAVTFLGEAASWARVGVLGVACMLVGWAATL
ncbi:MAG TPA: hypothetical protein VFF98_11295 [Novosphingobium sp.]|nr:hypothetical protein [Novosphingobium sp.]HZV10710.1 hypothetical protein [Novosphingobium sp.]